MTAFTASHADPNDTFEHRLRLILEMAATTLEVERVSLWRFASHNAAIECAGLYRNSAKVYESGAVLAREAAPAYFDAIERQRVIAAPDARTDPRTSGFRVPYLQPLNIFAMLDVPLRRGQDVIGVLCAEHVGAARMWTVDEQNFAISTANLIAVATADERRREALSQLDRELAGAARMQRQLLPPEMPHHPAIRFGSYYRTSRHAGGDYYDVLSLSGGRMGILVADVSGHGAPAAIVMAMIRAVVHTYPGVPDDPPAVLRYINTHFQFLWDTSMYTTAVYAVLDPSRKTLRMSSAGHPLPMKARRGGVDSPSIDTAMCLLWNVLGDIPCVEFPLEPGDRWAFFTDGITERQAPDGTMFDPERLSAALARHGAGAPAAIVDAINFGELNQFSAGHEPEDDQTLLVVGFD